MMIDETLALLRTHRSNINRYRRLLQTHLTELEREYIERRLIRRAVGSRNASRIPGWRYRPEKDRCLTRGVSALVSQRRRYIAENEDSLLPESTKVNLRHKARGDCTKNLCTLRQELHARTSSYDPT